MQSTIHIQTDLKNGLYDITGRVRSAVEHSGIINGVVHIYAKGATAAIMIQENWDDSVQNDIITLLDQLVPQGIWQHDKQDNNGAAHLKAGIVGPSESVPITEGKLGLSTWQNIFFCEFDGPRELREITVTLYGEM